MKKKIWSMFWVVAAGVFVCGAWAYSEDSGGYRYGSDDKYKAQQLVPHNLTCDQLTELYSGMECVDDIPGGVPGCSGTIIPTTTGDCCCTGNPSLPKPKPPKDTIV